jgi:tRNA-dihydrouridine synthase
VKTTRNYDAYFGNGDIDSPEKALQYKNEYGIDGIMIGRAAIGYPWIFNEIKHYFNTGTLQNLPLLIESKRCAITFTWAMEWKGERLGIETRPHYTNYFKGFILLNQIKTSNLRSS